MEINSIYLTKVKLLVSELELIFSGHFAMLGFNIINKTADFRRLNMYC